MVEYGIANADAFSSILTWSTIFSKGYLMKIYVCTAGSYSDYRIEAVFSTKEKADAWLEKRTYTNIEGKNVVYWDYQIEEYDLDAPLEDYQLHTWDFVRMLRDGTVVSIATMVAAQDDLWFNNPHAIHYAASGEFFQFKETDWRKTFSYCDFHIKRPRYYSNPQERAIKIANERRVQLITNGEWKEDAETTS